MIDRPGFREWVDDKPDPGWGLMPLTHITGGIAAEDIIRSGRVSLDQCDVFNRPLAYFFYGRPAYRLPDDTVIKVEAACPYCFIFDSAVIDRADSIYALDTGAFERRMYKHIMPEAAGVADFCLEKDKTRPNKIISHVFASMRRYFDGDTSKIPASEIGAKPYEFHARAYLELIASKGRNEPDDRICSIEVLLADPLPLAGNLRAIVVPHTLWDSGTRTPWLQSLDDAGVEIRPYIFLPGRRPDYYHGLLEDQVRDLYQTWNVI